MFTRTALSRLFCFLMLFTITLPCEAKTSRKSAIFPTEDELRVTTLQIFCEGGDCDSAYIQKNMRNLERHFRMTQKVIEEDYTHRTKRIEKVQRFFVKFHVVSVEAVKKLLKKFPLLSAETPPDYTNAFLVKGEGYLTRLDRKDKEKAVNLVLNVYVKEIYFRLNGTYPDHEKMITIVTTVVERCKNSIDVNSLQN